MSVSTFGPVTRSIISAARYTAGTELVRDCDTGLTLGDAWIARRQALASKRSGNYGQRAYWLGVARELRTRRVLGSSGAPVADFLAAHSVTVAVSRDYSQTFGRELVSECPNVSADCRRPGCVHTLEGDAAIRSTPTSGRHGHPGPGSDPDAEVCGGCGTRADWHDAVDGACPDDDGPHPFSVAAETMPCGCLSGSCYCD
jgi:hypothetical protein